MKSTLDPKKYVECSKCGKKLYSPNDSLKVDSKNSICNHCYNDLLYPAGYSSRMERVDEIPVRYSTYNQ